MKSSGWRALACGAAMGLAAAMPASAGTVTFEDVTPNLFGNGDSFGSGGFSFTTVGNFGTVDTSAAFFFAPPAGSAGQFYAGFDDSALRMSSGSDRLTIITGLDFAFVGSSLGSNSPGRLEARGLDAAGNVFLQSWDFGAPVAGTFSFATLGAGAMGVLASGVQSVTFQACLYNGLGGCLNPAQNGAQFAIDNIRAEIPEPASLALVLAALGVAGASTRRRQSN